MPRVLITVPEKPPQPYRFGLDREIVTLGRGSENDIVIHSGSVSGTHAEMHRVEGGYELVDVGSTNGLKLDGSRLAKVPLHSGSSVMIGDVTFEFSLTEEEQEAISQERPQLPPIFREEKVEPPAEKLPVRAAPAPVRNVAPEQDSSVSFGGVFIFLILALACFGVGLALRYKEEVNGSLIQAVMKKIEAEKPVPAEQK